MKHVYSYWIEGKTQKQCYSVADITFSYDAYDKTGRYLAFGNRRKSLQAAINDAKRFFKKRNNNTDCYSIYAHAILTDFYDDGTIVRKPEEDCAIIGSLDSRGQYSDSCEPVDWLN